MDDNFLFSRFLKLSDTNNSVEQNQIEKINPSTQKDQTNDQSRGFSPEELNTITVEILDCLKKNISSEKYNAFFNEKFLISKIDDKRIDFIANNAFVKKMIEMHYLTIIQESVATIMGEPFQVNINLLDEQSVDQGIFHVTEERIIKDHDEYTVSRGHSVKDTRFTIDSLNELNPTKDDLISTVNSKVLNHLSPETYKNTLDPKKTFANFIVGPSNNMAHASCLAVSENPGKVYPSLYLYSGSGLGKTHLLHAVANRISELYPNQCVCVMSARNFMNEVVDAIRNNKRESLREKYSSMVDVLMIDDIHELKNKASTQEEFFHVFNELRNNGKQLIFTSDKLPKEIDGIEERIKTRLSWGLVIDIQQPDVETRIAILKRKAHEEDIFLPDDVVALIASAVKNNIRELEGSLIRLGAYSSVFNVDIDVEIAKEQLKLSEMFEQKDITLESIARAISNYFKIPVADLRSKARQKEVTFARHMAMYFSYQTINATLNEIGKFYGKRDHTSVLHGVDKIKKLIKVDSQISQYAVDIEKDL